MEPFSHRLKTYISWGSISGIAFFVVYPTCNWLTSLRSHHYRLYLESELSVPFCPEWIWVYFSMYLLFLLPPFFLDSAHLKKLGQQLLATTLAAGVTYLLVPATLGFQRQAPAEGLLRDFYLKIFSVDKPHNLVPSLHVIWSTAICLALLSELSFGWKIVFGVWAILIAVSTLLVHQHHGADLIVALAYVLAARRYLGK